MSYPCGCCQGVTVVTPADIANRPGLDALAYRIGTYATFFESMKARLSSRDFRLPGGAAPLAALKTRDQSDPAIALLDAWAVIADILTYYQERIANEGFLGTAVEARSVLEIAALVGYVPRPGVAATTFVAYQVDGKDTTVIPAGSKVQSIPGPGELPQTFETSADLTGSPDFNTLSPRSTRPQILTPGRTDIYVAGVANNLNPDDRVLLISSPPTPGRIVAVQVQVKEACTRISLAPPPAPPAPPPPVALEDLVAPLSKPPAQHPATPLDLARKPADVFTPELDTAPGLVSAFHPEAGGQLYTALASAPVAPPVVSELHAFRVKAGLFGATAQPKQVTDTNGAVIGSVEWPLGESLSVTIIITWFATNGAAAGGGDLRLPSEGAVRGRRSTATLTAFFKIVRAGQTASNTIAADGQTQRFPTETQHVGPWDLNITTDATTGAVTFAFPQLKPTYSVGGDSSADTFRVTLDDGETLAPPLGKKATSDSGDRHFSVASDYKIDQMGQLLTESLSLTITDDSSVPADPSVTNIVNLDAAYDNIVPGSYAIVVRADTNAVLPAVVADSKQISLAKYGITGKVTQLTLRDPDPSKQFSWFDPAKDLTLAAARATTVFARSEQLTLAEEPVTDDIAGDTLELDDLHDGLQPGRWVVVKGERTDIPAGGVVSSELMMISGVEQNAQQDPTSTTPANRPGETLHSFVHLAGSLAYTYKRDGITVSGNVIRATHGETRNEVLGSGDSSKSMQEFTLHQGPLTYVSAPTPTGVASTLQVFVNGIQWHEIDSLNSAGPSDRVFVTSTDQKGLVTITFGDGVHGMRLPTGAENVKATYRVGIGAAGNLPPGKISLLSTKPLGARGVLNPIPASGGAGPETAESARRNIPTAAIALDRLVSIQDYADFSRTFAGIGKATAVQRSDSQRRSVLVTVAGAEGATLDPESELVRNLDTALHQFGDPHLDINISLCEILFLVVVARIKLMPDYQWTAVQPQIQSALLDAFSFDLRELGEPVFLSIVIATIQRIPGVAYVDVDGLDTIAAAELSTADALKAKFQRLANLPAPPDGIALGPAQLAFLNPATPDTLLLTENRS